MQSSLSPSYLSRVLTGQRNLTLSSAGLLAKAFKLTAEEMVHFFDLVELQTTEDENLKTKILKQMSRRSKKTKFIPLENFKVIADWYHFAILALAQAKGFRPDPKWISKKLRIDRLDAQLALERLVSLGFLKIEKSAVIAEDIDLQTPHDISSLAVQENHRQHLNLATKALNELAPELREFINRTLVMSEKDIPEAKKRIRSFIDSFNREMESPGAQEIFQINIQMYRLSQPVKESQ